MACPYGFKVSSSIASGTLGGGRPGSFLHHVLIFIIIVMRSCVAVSRPQKCLRCAISFRIASEHLSGHGTMPEFLTACMFMDRATADSYFQADVLGINNLDFSGSVVPFAPTSDREVIALKKYVRAFSRNLRPPYLLLTIKIPWGSALDHMFARDIQVLDRRPEKTIGFALAVNVSNYPSMRPEVQKIEDPIMAENLLLEGRQLLNLGS